MLKKKKKSYFHPHKDISCLSLAHALKCLSSTREKAAELLAGVIHFATGLTEVSFLHHGVWKRWNITGGEVQFLGNTAVAKVKFLRTVTTELQLLEPG